MVVQVDVGEFVQGLVFYEQCLLCFGDFVGWGWCVDYGGFLCIYLGDWGICVCGVWCGDCQSGCDGDGVLGLVKVDRYKCCFGRFQLWLLEGIGSGMLGLMGLFSIGVLFVLKCIGCMWML